MSLRLGANLSDRITIGSGSSLDNLNPMTILAWIYPTTLTTNRIIYCRGAAGAYRKMFRLLDGSGNLQLACARSGNLIYASNNAPLAVNNWYLVAATLDTGAAAGQLGHIYVGTLSALATEVTYGTAADSSGAVLDDAADSSYWGNTANNDLPLQGLLGYGAAFDRVFQPSDIHRWQKRPQLLPGYRDFHKFGGVQGAGIQRDLSGFGNHGVVTGAIPGPELPLGLVRQQVRRRVIAKARNSGVVSRSLFRPQAVNRSYTY